MTKFPARQGDSVNNSTHGNGSISTGDASVIFEDKPVACAGDMAKFADSASGAIQQGSACVLVNDRRVALVGDTTEKGGSISSGATRIQIEEGDPFVFIGPNVFVGEDIIFSAGSEPASNDDELEYFYTVEDASAVNLAYRMDADSEKLCEGLFCANKSSFAFPLSQPGELTFWVPNYYEEDN